VEQARASEGQLILGVLTIILLMAAALWAMGRVPICTCGEIKLWHGVVKSAENSQHITDWYTPSHIVHGFLFYFFLHLLLPRAPFATKFLIAIGIEASWEVLENTPFIISRYRTSTIAFDYFGDSILNSICDALAMMLGFLLAARLPVSATVALALAFELFTGILIRDNLTLNIIMLLYPPDWIRAWQEGGG
jgi:hypothetical protein